MFASMFLFSFAMSITPGPVNTVILSTSLNHGLKRSLPYISGATIGFTLLLIFKLVL
ncbi:putative membrane protein [Acinetobacter baumannii 24975_5]|nr:putative membrane protein [Acinetobacter baumannii 24975_5]